MYFFTNEELSPNERSGGMAWRSKLVKKGTCNLSNLITGPNLIFGRGRQRRLRFY